MKYCKRCDQNIESNIDICPKCGGNLENNVQENNGVYNIRNPFLELENIPTPINSNKENNTSVTQGFGIQANTNNVIQPTSLNTIPTTNVMGLNNQIQNNQNNSINSLNINEGSLDITDQNKSSSINEEKTQNIPNDGFLVFPNNNQTLSKTSEEAKENLERLKKTNNPVLDFDPQKIKEEKEKSEKEAKRKLEENKAPKYMSYIYIVLAAIMLFLTIIPLIYNFEVITLVHHLIIVVLLVIAYKTAPANKKVCSFTGLLTSVVMILTIIEKDYVTLSLGVTLLLAECFTYFVKDKKLKS